MAGESVFFKELAYVFLAAVIGGVTAWRVRQPLILGYVLAGILISPFTPGPAVRDTHTFEIFAEIGVIFLMFSIGLEFSFHELMKVKWVALIGGPIGIMLSGLLGLGIGKLVGWTSLQGFVVGIIVSVASTMVLSRLLIDRDELQSKHGTVMIGITLVEDIAVVVLTILLPVLGSLSPQKFFDVAKAIGQALLILVPVILLATFLVPRLLMRVGQTGNRELFLIVVLAICLGTAALTQAVGLSLALGAFVAGLIISASEFAHRTLDRVVTLRDAFVALFFVTIGTLIDPRAIASNISLLAILVGLIVIGKWLIWASLVRVFGYPLETAILAGVGLTQIGEFSFILVQVARKAGTVGDEIYNATLAASLVTILINAALVRWVPVWMKRLHFIAKAA